MKSSSKIFATLLLVLGNFIISQGQTTFKVGNVKKAKDLLVVSPYRTVVANRMNSWAETTVNSQDYNWQDTTEPPRRLMEDCADRNYPLVSTYGNPVIMATQIAYAQHRPLVLSPDMVWLMIFQGF